MRVIKRDGSIVVHDPSRITKAVSKAFEETGEVDYTDVICKSVDAHYVNVDRDVSVEEIQDRIELELMRAGCYETAKAFILYRENKSKVRVPRILIPKSEYIVEYPEVLEFCRHQEEKFWTSDEIDIEKDVQDLRVNMTEAERHGVITVLKLFTEYELRVGGEYWGGRFKEVFQRPEFQRMAATFSFFELGVHAPFYAKINQALFIDTEEFYNEYKTDEVLSARMTLIAEALDDDDILYSLGVFAIVEGGVLYSLFAFLKHFQTNGKNLAVNIGAGINFSVRDELMHHTAGAWVFKTLMNESVLAGKKIDPRLQERIEKTCAMIFEQETNIIAKIFEKGEISNITADDMKSFVAHRLNTCLENLGYQSMFHEFNTVIKDWFYKGIDSYIFHDFFAKQGREYTRKWNEKAFTWELPA